MAAETPPRTQDCNCFALRSAARHVTQLYDHYLATVGLHATQYAILSRLKRLGPMTINALARATLTDRTTLGRNVRPLQRDSLIGIEASAADRRAKEVRLTKAGEQRLQEAVKAWSQAQARFETTFGTKRSADLRATLRAVAASEFIPAQHISSR
jgi:DNA-binding MarR family transcriptional regulator